MYEGRRNAGIAAVSGLWGGGGRRERTIEELWSMYRNKIHNYKVV